jgi:hypothetical protein
MDEAALVRESENGHYTTFVSSSEGVGRLMAG